MPEVREVFEMSTQKIDQDPGALERQFERQRRAVRNRRAGAMAISAGLVLIVLAWVGVARRPADPSLIEPPPQPPAPSTVVTPDELRLPWVGLVDLRTGRATPLPDEPFRSIPDASSYVVSPDGSKVAFQATGISGSGQTIYIANIDGSSGGRIFQAPPHGSDPAWSPDGRSIVFVGADDAIYPSLFVADVETDTLSRLFRSTDDVSHPSFSPDGRTVLFTMVTRLPSAWRTDLWTVPATGGTPTRLIEHAAHGSYSPDGTTIAYRRTAPQPDAFCGKCWWTEFGITFAAADGSEQPGRAVGGVVAPPDALDWSAVRWSPDGSQVVSTKPAVGGLSSQEITVIDVASGSHHRIGSGVDPSWVDSHTLLVADFGPRVPA